MSILEVKNLTKQYDDTVAVNQIDFSLPIGQCVTLIGPNGAGKTTVLRILAGLIKPTSGDILFNGEQNGDFRSSIGYLPQYPVFYSWMTGLEFLMFSAQISSIHKKEAEKRALELLKKVGLYDDRNKTINKYSGGMKQRLGIAQAIIHRPTLLILDEPVSALDPIGRREVLTLMKELKQEMTILFSTHILSDADEISDSLLLMNKGKIIESGTVESLRNKYQTSIIELELVGNKMTYIPIIKELSQVNDVRLERQLLLITVNEMEKARKELLQLIVEKGWELTHFKVNRASLEEMFMKVVKSDAMADTV